VEPRGAPIYLELQTGRRMKAGRALRIQPPSPAPQAIAAKSGLHWHSLRALKTELSNNSL